MRCSCIQGVRYGCAVLIVGILLTFLGFSLGAPRRRIRIYIMNFMANSASEGLFGVLWQAEVPLCNRKYVAAGFPYYFNLFSFESFNMDI